MNKDSPKIIIMRTITHKAIRSPDSPGWKVRSHKASNPDQSNCWPWIRETHSEEWREKMVSVDYSLSIRQGSEDCSCFTNLSLRILKVMAGSLLKGALWLIVFVPLPSEKKRWGFFAHRKRRPCFVFWVLDMKVKAGQARGGWPNHFPAEVWVALHWLHWVLPERTLSPVCVACYLLSPPASPTSRHGMLRDLLWHSWVTPEGKGT